MSCPLHYDIAMLIVKKYVNFIIFNLFREISKLGVFYFISIQK